MRVALAGGTPLLDAATELSFAVVADEVRRRLDDIREEMTPERAAARLRSIVDTIGLDRGSLVSLAAVAIAGILDHDRRARQSCPQGLAR
jgi:hypothetical protein